MKARMIVPYGAYEQGELVFGMTAKTMIEEGMAAQIVEKAEPEPDSESKPKKPESTKGKKDAGGAPENKAAK